MAKKKLTKEKLADIAAEVRKELTVPKQNDVFRVAVEVGYLAANTDGTVDDAEKKAIIDAVGVLSQGAVIEWEVDAIVEEIAKKEGDQAARAKALGAQLKELGQPDAGLLFGAYVAQSTSGIDKAEAAVLKEIGKAAGVNSRRVGSILKTVGAEDVSED